ncbi:YciI family protein [Rhizobium sp. L51/94]|uniref:YciI family protein n=1 Tax=Rhizobium sp. L51/94 TaxID=2819999 RepID=UPI00214B7DFF|nr:transcription initiation protein [Rhizobium sp. L51/94]
MTARGNSASSGVLTETAQLPEEKNMPKFVTIGYGDQAGNDRTPRAARDMAREHDASLRRMGALIGIAGQPVRVRNTDAIRVETEDGAYMASSLPVAGFAVIEAKDLEEAIEMVSKAPCAVAHGVVEVWPLQDE